MGEGEEKGKERKGNGRKEGKDGRKEGREKEKKGRKRNGSKGEEEPTARSPVAQPDFYRDRTSVVSVLPRRPSFPRFRYPVGAAHGGPARERRGGGFFSGGPQEIRLLVLLQLPHADGRGAAGLRGLGLHGRPPVLAAKEARKRLRRLPAGFRHRPFHLGSHSHLGSHPAEVTRERHTSSAKVFQDLKEGNLSFGMS